MCRDHRISPRPCHTGVLCWAGSFGSWFGAAWVLAGMCVVRSFVSPIQFPIMISLMCRLVMLKEKSMPLPSSPMNERTRRVACVSSQYMAYTFVYSHIKEISTAWGLVSFLKLRPVILAVRKLTSQGHLGVQLLGPRTPWTKISSAGRSLWTPNIHYHLSLSSWMKILPTKSPKYEEQGQQRGRKPQRLSPKAAAKRRAKGKESKKGPTKTKASKVAKSKVSKTPGKGAARRVRKEEWGEAAKEKNKRVRRASQSRAASSAASPAEASMSEAAPRPSTSKRARRAKQPGTEAPVTSSTEAPVVPSSNQEQPEFSIPDDAVEAPAHCTYNAVYSTAYRRAQATKCTVAECKNKGKHASWLLRVHHKISPSLSGIPREPRDKKNNVSKGKPDPRW